MAVADKIIQMTQKNNTSEYDNLFPVNGIRKANTVTVGTTTRGHTIRDCDYLCDGTNDGIKIQAALADTRLTSFNGGTVLLLEGTYVIDQNITISIPNKVTLKGISRNTTLTTIYSGTSAPKVTLEDNNSELKNISITNMAIYMNKSGGIIDSISFGVIFILHSSSYILGNYGRITNSKGFKIISNTFDPIDNYQGQRGHFIFNNDLDMTAESNNGVETSKIGCIIFRPDSFVNYCNYHTVLNNRIFLGTTNTTNPTDIARGIYLYNSSNNIVRGNKIFVRDNFNKGLITGIDIESGTSSVSCQYNMITDNLIENLLINNTSYTLTNTEIRGIYNRLGDNFGVNSYNKFNNNMVLGMSGGIRIAGGHHHSVLGNTVIPQGGSWRTINIDGASNILVSGNVLSGQDVYQGSTGTNKIVVNNMFA